MQSEIDGIFFGKGKSTSQLAKSATPHTAESKVLSTSGVNFPRAQFSATTSHSNSLPDVAAMLQNRTSLLSRTIVFHKATLPSSQRPANQDKYTPINATNTSAHTAHANATHTAKPKLGPLLPDRDKHRDTEKARDRETKTEKQPQSQHSDKQNQKHAQTQMQTTNQNTSTNTKQGMVKIDFVLPDRELYAEENMRKLLLWSPVLRIGCGLINLGNTCFLNSVLQALTYTPPLAQYMLGQSQQQQAQHNTQIQHAQTTHSQKCTARSTNTFCLFCELERHVSRAFSGKISMFAPKNIVMNLRNLSRSFRPGRQEDAHEFIRFVLDSLQTRALAQYPNPKKLSERVKETSVIHRVFGGYLRSQVKCSVCKHESNTYDPFLDLSLEVLRANSVKGALKHFTQIERLDKNNKYRCSKCAKKVEADKQLTIFRTPNTLCLHLKRFEFAHAFGGKINKDIAFDVTLDLSPFVSRSVLNAHSHARPAQSNTNQHNNANTNQNTNNNSKQGSGEIYHLYAVLVHAGFSVHSGHYYCFVKAPSGQWYCMDDERVQQVSLNTVLAQKAYMLFYVKDRRSFATWPLASKQTPQHTPLLSPRSPALSPLALARSPSLQAQKVTPMDLDGLTADEKLRAHKEARKLAKKRRKELRRLQKAAENGDIDMGESVPREADGEEKETERDTDMDENEDAETKLETQHTQRQTQAKHNADKDKITLFAPRPQTQKDKETRTHTGRPLTPTLPMRSLSGSVAESEIAMQRAKQQQQKRRQQAMDTELELQPDSVELQPDSDDENETERKTERVKEERDTDTDGDTTMSESKSKNTDRNTRKHREKNDRQRRSASVPRLPSLTRSSSSPALLSVTNTQRPSISALSLALSSPTHTKPTTTQATPHRKTSSFFSPSISGFLQRKYMNVGVSVGRSPSVTRAQTQREDQTESEAETERKIKPEPQTDADNEGDTEMTTHTRADARTNNTPARTQTHPPHTQNANGTSRKRKNTVMNGDTDAHTNTDTTQSDIHTSSSESTRKQKKRKANDDTSLSASLFESLSHFPSLSNTLGQSMTASAFASEQKHTHTQSRAQTHTQTPTHARAQAQTPQATNGKMNGKQTHALQNGKPKQTDSDTDSDTEQTQRPPVFFLPMSAQAQAPRSRSLVVVDFTNTDMKGKQKQNGHTPTKKQTHHARTNSHAHAHSNARTDSQYGMGIDTWQTDESQREQETQQHILSTASEFKQRDRTPDEYEMSLDKGKTKKIRKKKAFEVKSGQINRFQQVQNKHNRTMNMDTDTDEQRDRHSEQDNETETDTDMGTFKSTKEKTFKKRSTSDRARHATTTHDGRDRDRDRQSEVNSSALPLRVQMLAQKEKEETEKRERDRAKGKVKGQKHAQIGRVSLSEDQEEALELVADREW